MLPSLQLMVKEVGIVELIIRGRSGGNPMTHVMSTNCSQQPPNKTPELFLLCVMVCKVSRQKDDANKTEGVKE